MLQNTGKDQGRGQVRTGCCEGQQGDECMTNMYILMWIKGCPLLSTYLIPQF